MKIDVMSPVWRAWMVKDQWSSTHASVVAWAASLSQEFTYEWNYEEGYSGCVLGHFREAIL